MKTQLSTISNLVRFDRGVLGYLDLQTAMNEAVIATFQPALSPAGDRSALLLANILELAKLTTAAEIRVRENERLITLNRTSGETAFDECAKALNDHAIRYAERTLLLIANLKADLRRTQKTVQGVAELRTVHKNKDFSEALTEAKQVFLTNATQLNFTNNAEFAEIVELWDQTMEHASSHGLAGVFSKMSDALEEFVKRRCTAERGTSPASPLPWWKYVVIGLYIGAAAFAVFACFYWGGCTWVWPAISATAPWIFKIVEMGC